jgi:hypothetical protein
MHKPEHKKLKDLMSISLVLFLVPLVANSFPSESYSF